MIATDEQRRQMRRVGRFVGCERHADGSDAPVRSVVQREHRRFEMEQRASRRLVVVAVDEANGTVTFGERP